MGLGHRDADGFRRNAGGQAVAFTLLTNAENRERQTVAALIQEDLARVGVRVTLQALPFPAFVTRLRETHDWEALLFGWGAAVPPDPLLARSILASSGELHLWHPEQVRPASDWEAKSDALLGELGRSFDPGERRALYREMSEILAQEQALIFTHTAHLHLAASASVRNLRPTVFRPHALWNAQQLFLAEP
jgi:peptide/nickel transport system substrate-binding protein